MYYDPMICKLITYVHPYCFALARSRHVAERPTGCSLQLCLSRVQQIAQQIDSLLPHAH